MSDDNKNNQRDTKNLTNNVFVDNTSYIEYLIKYFNSCQTGRSKPDNKKGGTVLESLDNYGEIKVIKKTLNTIFNLDQAEIDDINDQIDTEKLARYNNKPKY